MLLVPVIIIVLLHRRKVLGDTSCYVCDDTMYRFEDSCYQFVTDRTDLSTGRSNCEKIGFHLVFIETSEEQDFLASTGDEVTPRREYWIGIEKNADGDHVWMDGSALTYSNFGSMDYGGECFRLRHQSDYIWADRECDHDYGYICERGHVCEENTYTFGDSCYKFNTDKTDMATARTACEEKGFHLVYIQTNEEQDFLASYVDSVSPSREYWIGIEKNADGEQVWMDGSPLTYSNIDKIKDDGECFRMKDKGAYAWEDHDCTHTHYGSICEREGGCKEVATTHSPTTSYKPTTIDVTTTPTQHPTTVEITTEIKKQTTVVTERVLESTSTAPSTTMTKPLATVQKTTESITSIPTSTAPRTTDQVQITTEDPNTVEIKRQTALAVEQTLETTSTVPSTTVTEPLVTSQFLQQTTGSTTSIPTSTVPPTTADVLTTSEDISTTKMDIVTTVTKQEAIQTTSKITSTAHTTPLSDDVKTTPLTSAPSTLKTADHSPGIPSSTASSTPSLTTSETLPTITAEKGRLLSSRFRLLSTNTLLVDADVSLIITARSVVRCASFCINAELCSHFSYAQSTSRCILGYTEENDRLVKKIGTNTYMVH